MSLNDYWRSRGTGYMDEFSHHSWAHRTRFGQQEKEVLRVLGDLKFSSVIEAACGYGRMTRIILNNFQIDKYDAFDISSGQIENAKKYVGNKANFTVSTIEDYSFTPASHDLVCAFEFLMHLSPDKIQAVIDSLVKSSKKYVVNLDWQYAADPVEVGGYCFQHNYPELYRKAGVNLTKTVELRDHWLSRFRADLRLRQKMFVAYINAKPSEEGED